MATLGAYPSLAHQKEGKREEALRGRRSVDEIDLLPHMLREQSLSD